MSIDKDKPLRQMAWLPIGGGDSEKVLHIFHQGRWTPYSQTTLSVGDYHVPTQHGVPSKGFATMQKLLKQGYELLATDDVMRSMGRQIDCSEVADAVQ